MSDVPTPLPNQTYEFHLRILGTELFAVGFTVSDGSNRWAVIGLVTILAIISMLAFYGPALLNLVHKSTG
jgi:hypothetical protein